MLKIKIKTDNAAFTDDPRAELARMLENLAHSIRHTSKAGGKLFDPNGNAVGEWTLTGRGA